MFNQLPRNVNPVRECVDTAASFTNQQKGINIGLFLADDLGYGDRGCYGQKFIEIRHLDEIAAEEICFTEFYLS